MICFTKDSFTKQGQQPTGGEITLMFNPDPDRWGLSPPDVYDDFIREELLLLLLENPDAFGAFDHVERMDIPGGYIALKYSGERTARGRGGSPGGEQYRRTPYAGGRKRDESARGIYGNRFDSR